MLAGRPGRARQSIVGLLGDALVNRRPWLATFLLFGFCPAISAPGAEGGSDPRVELATGESLMAEDLELDGARVRFDSILGPIDLSRRLVREVHGAEKDTVLWRDAFARIATDWAPTGSPTIVTERARSAPASLLLANPAEGLKRRFATPVESGALSLMYYDTGITAPRRRWSIALGFGAEATPDLTIVPGWESASGTISIAESLGISTLPWARRTGWHELEVSFGPDQLLVTVDDAVVVASLSKGVDRPLTSISFAVDPVPADSPRDVDPAPRAARVWIDDVALTERAPLAFRLVSDPERTDVLETTGDQWLGELLGADPQGIRLRVAAGQEVSIPWPRVRSARFPDVVVPESTWTGEIGDLTLRDGSRLIVVREALDEARWQVSHPRLGRRSLVVDQVADWTPRVVGRRIALAGSAFHSGTKLVVGFRRPRPDGTAYETSFELPEPAGSAVACLRVVGMEGMGPQAPFASTLRAGSMRSELWINGRNVDFFNRLLVARSMADRELRLPIPAGFLEVGSNVLRIRGVPDPATGGFDEIEVLSIALEQTVDYPKRNDSP